MSKQGIAEITGITGTATFVPLSGKANTLPSSIVLTVEVPTGEDLIFASVTSNGLTEFTYQLSATPGTGYRLNYQINYDE